MLSISSLVSLPGHLKLSVCIDNIVVTVVVVVAVFITTSTALRHALHDVRELALQLCECIYLSLSLSLSVFERLRKIHFYEFCFMMRCPVNILELIISSKSPYNNIFYS